MANGQQLRQKQDPHLVKEAMFSSWTSQTKPQHVPKIHTLSYQQRTHNLLPDLQESQRLEVQLSESRQRCAPNLLRESQE